MTGTLGARALAWVQANRASFEISDAEAGLELVVRLKRAGELALMADVLARGLPRGANARPDVGRELLELAWAQTGRGARLLTAIEHQPAVAATYVTYVANQLRSPELEARLASPAWQDKLDRLGPFAILGVAQSLRAAGLPCRWRQNELYQHLPLASWPSPVWDPHVAATITHAVFWLTDLGRRPDAVPAAARDYLAETLPGWFSAFVAAGDLDLVGEWIMAAHCLGGCAPAAAWDALAAGQLDNGMVPLRVPFGGPPGVFKGHYHSTMVAVMAATMCDHEARSA